MAWTYLPPLEPVPETIPFRQPAHRPYRSAMLFFGGFTQKIEPQNGIFALSEAAYGHAPKSWVQYFPWYVDVESLARTVETLADESERHNETSLRIGVVGYSFGGFTAVQFCKELQCDVDELVLCDPVGRWGTGKLHALGWSKAYLGSKVAKLRHHYPALTPFVPGLKIHTTPNVLRCRGVRQENDWPSGHDVEHWEPMAPFPYLDCFHTEIETSPEFRLLTLDAISRIVGDAPRAAA